MRAVMTLAMLAMTVNVAAAQEALTVQSLKRMSLPELEALYRGAAPAPIPTEYWRGHVLAMTGSLANLREAAGNRMWRGKTFEPATGELVNRWLLGLDAVRARVEDGESWLDGGPTLVMDYRGTSRVIWRDMRDEVREVGPGLYLGVTYRTNRRPTGYAAFFALESRAR